MFGVITNQEKVQRCTAHLESVRAIYKEVCGDLFPRERMLALGEIRQAKKELRKACNALELEIYGKLRNQTKDR